jgi:uncharacterized protein
MNVSSATYSNSFLSKLGFNMSILFGSKIEIVAVIPFMEDAAFAIFKRYSDKDFSSTDCTSFSIMRSLKLKSAFAFDRHFDQFEGIGRLP